MKKLINASDLSKLSELSNAIQGAILDHSETSHIVTARKEERKALLEARKIEDNRTLLAAQNTRNRLNAVSWEAKEAKKTIGARIIQENISDLSEIRSSVKANRIKRWGDVRLLSSMSKHEIDDLSSVERSWIIASEALHSAIRDMSYRKVDLIKHYADNPTMRKVINVELDINKLIAKEQKKEEKENHKRAKWSRT